MEWRGRRRSSNVDDRRGQPLRGGAGPGLLMLVRVLPWLLRSKGGRALLLVGVLAFAGARMLGIDLLQLTTEGRGVHAGIMPLAKKIEAELFSVLTEAERDQLRTMLVRLREAAGDFDAESLEG